MKRFTHDADLRGMVVLRSLGFQLVPFKLHRFRKQRRLATNEIAQTGLSSLPPVIYYSEQLFNSKLAYKLPKITLFI
ncbi:hypothetical protein [Aeromonas salmonicida]|uniref:hypothetical protein n=1 Tax=Aeromonas salmonicida TaxID=645 RepID=UPI0012D8CE33|nr:hypothetical protein [Aeromonas salmonicida]